MEEYQKTIDGKKLRILEKRTHEIVIKRIRGRLKKEKSYTVSICTDIETSKLAKVIKDFVVNYEGSNQNIKPDNTQESIETKE